MILVLFQVVQLLKRKVNKRKILNLKVEKINKLLVHSEGSAESLTTESSDSSDESSDSDSDDSEEVKKSNIIKI